MNKQAFRALEFAVEGIDRNPFLRVLRIISISYLAQLVAIVDEYLPRVLMDYLSLFKVPTGIVLNQFPDNIIYKR